jgi:replication factor A3
LAPGLLLLSLIFNLALPSQDAHLQLNHAVEIIGKVQQDLSIRVMASTDMGPEGNVGMCLTYTHNIVFVSSHHCPDFNAIEAVVDATHRYHEIFYERQE